MANGPQPPALAADGKRIRGANRDSGAGVYFETVTLVTYDGRPLVRRCCRDEGGEIAAAKALLEEIDVRGCLITLDALHTTHDTERTIVDVHDADYLFTVKGNCPETQGGFLFWLTLLDFKVDPLLGGLPARVAVQVLEQGAAADRGRDGSFAGDARCGVATGGGAVP